MNDSTLGLLWAKLVSEWRVGQNLQKPVNIVYVWPLGKNICEKNTFRKMHLFACRI